jgi:hypothetical protein
VAGGLDAAADVSVDVSVLGFAAVAVAVAAVGLEHRHFRRPRPLGLDGAVSLQQVLRSNAQRLPELRAEALDVVGIVNQPRAEGEGKIRDPYTGPGMKCP